jgi:hypothetical protein
MKMKKLPSEANSEEGDLSGEGRLGENRELMDKNRIEGRHGASRGHNTPKTSGMPVEVNPAAVRWSNVQLPGEWKRSGHGGTDCLFQHSLKSPRRKTARSQQRS